MKRDSINDCEDSSFEPILTDTAARVDDCRVIISNISGGGTWTLSHGEAATPLVSYGTCSFDASRAGSDIEFLKIGNQDIIDLINESIRRFGDANGNLNAKGTVDCQVEGIGTSTMNWLIRLS